MFIIDPFRFGTSGGDPYFSSVAWLLHFDQTGSATQTDYSSYARTSTYQVTSSVGTIPEYGAGSTYINLTQCSINYCTGISGPSIRTRSCHYLSYEFGNAAAAGV